MPKAPREGSGKRRAAGSVRQDRESAGRRSYARRTDDRRHRDLVAAAADWLWECGAEGRIDFLSPDFEASTGVAPQLLLGKRLSDLAAVDTGSAVPDEPRAAIAAAKPFRDLVFKLGEAAGPSAWLEIAGTPIVEAGAFRGYCGLGKTVTARIEGALALRDSDRRHREFFEVASDWFWETDAQGRLSYISSNIEGVLGLPMSAYIGKRVAETEGIVIEPEAGRANLAAFKARQPYRDFVYRRKLPNGKIVWLSSSGAPFYGEDGAFLGYRGIARDVTGRIEAEHALRDSEQRYKHPFKVASDWFWEADAEGRLSYVSPNIETVLGLPVSAYLGKRLADTEGVSIDAAAGKAVLDALRARRPYRDFIYSRKLANGQVVWISSSGAPRYGEDGALLGYRGVARDVTAQIEAEHRLQRLERQYRQLFEDSTDSYWEQDAQGRLTHLSSSFETATGIPAAELLGKRLNDVALVKIDPKSGAQALAAIKARARYRDLVHTLTRPDGRLVHIGTSGVPMYGENGEFRGYCGISKDITAQVEAERALRESEQRFRELFEIASDYFWEADEHQRITYLSENYEAVFGIPPSQTLGKRLTETPDVSVDPEMGKMAIAAIRAQQPYRDFVYSRKFPDGKTRWFKTSGIPIFDRDGRFRGYRGVGADLTAHVEADQAARLAQSRLHDAVAHVTQPFVFYDAQHRATAFNQAFTDLHREPGGTAPVAQGVSFRELAEWQLRVGFYAEGADEDEITLDALVEGYESARKSTYHLGDGRWMLVVYRRLPGGGRVGLWTDVTEIKRSEAERRRLEAQLLHSQRLEALGTLAGGASHEINNALVPVIALTKLVASHLPEDSRDRRNLGTVLVGAERSRVLVKQILAFSRKEQEGHRRESVDLGAVLRDALQLMRATVPTSIRLEEQIKTVPPVAGDPNQLHQVIVNLVTNAAHAIGEAHGTITIGLGPDADAAELRLWVMDTGCGMDAATKARIFEPFFTTKEVGKGTGLGLAVVHGIIKDHGGRIEVESTPGRGTRFDVVLPLQAATAGAAA